MSPEFLEEFGVRRAEVQSACEAVAEELRLHASTLYGDDVLIPLKPFFDQYTALPSKRIRGVLVGVAHDMIGGNMPRQSVMRTAALTELMHAYILGLDDIQDRAETRHGIPVLHVALAQDYRLRGVPEPEFRGLAMSLIPLMLAQHYAAAQISSLNGLVSERRNLLSVTLHNYLFGAGIGQIYDLNTQINEMTTVSDVERVMRLKTALYTVTMPLKIGMILAEASGSELAIVNRFGDVLGEAFQLGDDRQAYEDDNNGKDKQSDIKEGKMTLIVLEMLSRCEGSDKERFIRQCLGNPDLTKGEFEEFVRLAHDIGALAVVREREDRACNDAIEEINNFPDAWGVAQKDFLSGLAAYFKVRTV